MLTKRSSSCPSMNGSRYGQLSPSKQAAGAGKLKLGPHVCTLYSDAHDYRISKSTLIVKKCT